MKARVAPWAVGVPLSAALAATILLMPGTATAFECTRVGKEGPSVAWPARTIVVRPNGGGAEVSADEAERELRLSVAAWNDIACSDIEIVVGEPTEERLAWFDWRSGSDSPNNHNLLIFRGDDPQDPLDAWLHKEGAIAITTVTFERYEGRILDADIEFNDRWFTFSTCTPGEQSCAVDVDFRNTLTHELGHLLGLEHSADVDATMFRSTPRGDLSKRTLASDDERAVCTIYPAGQPAAECYGVGRADPPELTFEQTACGAGPAAAPLAVLVLVVARKGRARRRDRTTAA